MTITTSYLHTKFNEFNKTYFNNEISMKGCFIITKHKSDFGRAWLRQENIEISTYYERDELDYLNTLLHEMLHLFVWQKYKCKGHRGEWARLAAWLTKATKGKYGNIQRCGGGNKKKEMREENIKTCNFLIFTDMYGELSIIKFNNMQMIGKVRCSRGQKKGTKMYHIESTMKKIITLPTRKVHCRSLSWNQLRNLKITFDDVMKHSTTKTIKVF